MTSRTMVLNRIQEYCHLKCPHRETCAECDNCPIYPFKDGKVPQAFKKTMTQSQLRNLSKSPRNGKSIQARMDSEENIEQFSRKSESQELG